MTCVARVWAREGQRSIPQISPTVSQTIFHGPLACLEGVCEHVCRGVCMCEMSSHTFPGQ